MRIRLILVAALSCAGAAGAQPTAVVQPAANMAVEYAVERKFSGIGAALHNYDTKHGKLPPVALIDKKGKLLLSWRVAVLPQLGEEELYKKFKFDEPWDSDHNKALIPLMPKHYADPRIKTDPKNPGTTYFKVLSGKQGVFAPPGRYSIRSLTESNRGASNVVFVVAAGDPVPWTKPEDIDYDDEKPIPDLTKPFKNVIVLMGDGRVWSVDPKGSRYEDALRASANPESPKAWTLDQP